MRLRSERGVQPMIVIPPDLLALATPEEREQYRLYLIGEAVAADEWEP